MLRCPSCDGVFEPDDNFCGRCGHRLHDPDTTSIMDPVGRTVSDAIEPVDAIEPGDDDGPDDDGPDDDQPEESVPDGGVAAQDGVIARPDEVEPDEVTAEPDEVEADGVVAVGDEVMAGPDSDGDPDNPALAGTGKATASQVVQVVRDDEPTSTSLDEEASHPEVVTVTGGVDLAACPDCETLNSVQRSRCARCGALLQDERRDLVEGDDRQLQPLPSAAAQPAPEPVIELAPQRRHRRGRGVGVAIVVAGIVLGGGLGAAWALGLGPFERDVVEVAFATDSYPDQPGPLSASTVATTDVRPPEGGREFEPGQLVDTDLDTAWVAADAADAALVFTFPKPVWITSIEVANGDQLDEETFAGTARVRTLMVDLQHGSVLRATLINGDGTQVIRPPTPVLTDRVRLEVADVTEGSGAAMSELRFVGHVANAADASAYETTG